MLETNGGNQLMVLSTEFSESYGVMTRTRSDLLIGKYMSFTYDCFRWGCSLLLCLSLILFLPVGDFCFLILPSFLGCWLVVILCGETVLFGNYCVL